MSAAQSNMPPKHCPVSGSLFHDRNQTPILVMEFLPTNLTYCIETYGTFPHEISYSILHDVGLGMHYLHNQVPPIIH